MTISTKRQYQDTASIREPGRCRPEFCDQPVDQTSRDPKLVARRNHKFLSHFRLIGQGDESPPHALARVPNPRRRQIAIGKRWPQSQSTVYDLSTVRQPEVRGEIRPRIKCSSLRFKCNSLLYLNRGLPGSAVYDLSTVRQ